MATQKIPVGVVLAIGAVGIVVAVLATSLLMAYQRIPNAGNVKAIGVGVYWDSACTSNVTSINWGFLEPGETDNRTVYIKNTGNTPVTLNMTTDNWSTGAYGSINLSWNRESYVLDPEVNPIIQAVLTISVSPDIDGVASFSFDIIITGIEHA